MNITLRETLKLDIFNGFNLITGEKGLGRIVSRIGLLDHEMINPIKGQFVEGEFALSTLLAAKDDPELILTSVQYLIESGASGLGVKDIYYKELPEEVLFLAEAADFPIFMFDNSVYFEDVITEFKGFIDEIKYEETLSMSLQDIVERDVPIEKIVETYKMTVGTYSGSYNGIYIRLRENTYEESFLTLKGHQLNKRLTILFSSVYKNGLFIIFNHSTQDAIELILKQEGIGNLDYYYGLGAVYEAPKNYQSLLNDCLMNCRIADVEAMRSVNSKRRGLYQLIMPYRGLEGFQLYKENHLNPIISYDGVDNMTLFETVIAFVKNEGQVKATAAALNQHSNTIRYRLSKVKTLLEIEGSEIILYERLSLAVKIHLIEQLSY